MDNGYFLVNKLPGPTSHDVIDTLRKITGVRRIGHAGTLDPFAEGLLLVGVGREATRNLGKFVGLDKYYQAVLQLGAVSDTYDKTGIITKGEMITTSTMNTITREDVDTIIDGFIGKQKQMPPQYSAKKVNGEKAYALARKGKTAALHPHEIEIYDLAVISDDLPKTLSITIHCSSGTYIRALGHEIGKKLGCGAYVQELKRTAIGLFNQDEAIELDELTSGNWPQHLISFNTVMATGTFEVLHPGHRYYLKEARKLGAWLVVVVARDKTAERLRRRVLRTPEGERLKNVQSLEWVDEAVLGDEADPYESVRRIAPDIIALGYDQRNFVHGLPDKITQMGLKTKIARMGAHYPEKFKSSFMK